MVNLQNIEINLSKNAFDNAKSYFDKSKKAKGKLESLHSAIKTTENKIASIGQVKPTITITNRSVNRKNQEWYARFHYFFTSQGKLVIAGRNATDNQNIYSKYLEKTDMFFHADITGASAVVLKNGSNASESELLQTAQFAASYSRAWKISVQSVDVYCVKKEAVSRSSHGEYVSRGGFMIKGGRKWFRNTKLGLAINLKSKENLEIVPIETSLLKTEGKWLKIRPGNIQNLEMAQQIHKNMEHQETILQTNIESEIPGPSEIIKD